MENILRKYSYFFSAFTFGSPVHRECNAGYNKREIPHSFQASLLVSRVSSIFSFNLREFLSLPVIRGILPVLQMSLPLRQMTASKTWRFVTLPKECSTITSMKKQWRMCILSRNCCRRQALFVAVAKVLLYEIISSYIKMPVRLQSALQNSRRKSNCE